MNANRPQWLNEVDESQKRHQETGWARYVETPKMFAEGTQHTYTNESGETVQGAATGLMIQAHGEQIRRVVMEREGNREYPRVLDVELDD